MLGSCSCFDAFQVAARERNKAQLRGFASLEEAASVFYGLDGRERFTALGFQDG